MKLYEIIHAVFFKINNIYVIDHLFVVMTYLEHKSYFTENWVKLS